MAEAGCTPRPPEAGDGRAFGEIAALFDASRRAAMPWLPVLHGLDQTAAFFAGLAASHDFRLVRDEDGALEGFIAFDAGWIDHLYLAPAARGRGIGAALLACALADGRPRQLWCFAGNGPARRFYLRHGFLAVEYTDGRGNEEGCADVRYRHPGRRVAAGRVSIRQGPSGVARACSRPDLPAYSPAVPW